MLNINPEKSENKLIILGLTLHTMYEIFPLLSVGETGEQWDSDLDIFVYLK